VSINVVLDTVSSKSLNIDLSETGDPAVGFQAGEPEMSESEVIVSGPQTFVDQVVQILAEIDIEGVNENVNRALTLKALNENGEIVDGVTLSPSSVTFTQEVTQRGGYRNVVVKVITKGQIASGYRVTNISVFPPAVTVFSSDPNLVEDLPGYVETEQLDLTGVKDDLDVGLALNLPPGITLVGEQTVEVQVGIATIEGSITLENMEVMVSGITEGYEVNVSPQTVDVILSGPLPILDSLTADDVRIYIELEGEEEGIYQRIPQVEISISEIVVESILPASLEIEILKVPTPTSTNAKTLNQVDAEATQTPTPQSVTPTP
jgi:YbbR domain-containing protein